MTTPWSNPAVNLIIIVSGSPNTGLFLYNGTPAAGNPPVLWAVAPGVTADPFGNTVSAVLGAGVPGGQSTQIDAAGDVTLTGTGGTQLALTPAAALPFSLTSTLTGVMQTVMSLGSGDGNQNQAGIVSGITVGTGTAAKMGTLVMSPYGSTGMGLLLQAENDGATDTASALIGTITTTGGAVTFTPSLAVYPSALVAYSGGGTVNVITHTAAGSGSDPIPANAAATALGECWGHAGNGGPTGGTSGGVGAGSGGYSAEPALGITPGGSVAWVVGGHNADTTLTGSAVTVTAHAGQDGSLGGAGAPASANTVARAGAAGGAGGAAGGGGGGGGSPGPGGLGGAGHNGTTGAGGNGGTGASGGANGGKGGAPGAGHNGAAGGSPGAGPGGSGFNTATSTAGPTGQTRLTFTAGSFTVLASVTQVAFTDQFGNSIQAGNRVTLADGITYRTERRTLVNTGAPQTINSLTATLISGLTVTVGVGTYRFRGMIFGTNGGVAAVQAIRIGSAATVTSIAGTVALGNYGAFSGLTESNFALISATGVDLAPAAAFSIGFSFSFWFEGIVTFSTAGAFQVNARCVTAAADTWTVNANSWFEVLPV